MSPKKLGKSIICSLLEVQVKRLRRRNDFKVVAVAGSVGKTSTKFAIAKTLGSQLRVRYQEGNYNDRLTVPLVLFGHNEPGIFNLFAWVKILLQNESKLRQPFPYDVAVLELGTDAPGQLRKFAYLKPELCVITAIAAEHMVFFGTLNAVAQEELVPLAFSAKSLLNIDDIPAEYLPNEEAYTSYGLRPAANYAVINREPRGLRSQQLSCQLPRGEKFQAAVQLLGAQGAKSAMAAFAVADLLGLPVSAFSASLAKLAPVAGRLQILAGQKDSTIIDDTYNASPVAVLAALEVLQTSQAQPRIAILGSMNELGEGSAAAHQQVGEACDPAKLDLVVTIGKAARDHLAPAAKQRGCVVESFDSPYDAGQYVQQRLKPGTVVLAKGSQNGVFAEEALKPLLAKPEDAAKLVRQSAYWLGQKQAQFGKP